MKKYIGWIFDFCILLLFLIFNENKLRGLAMFAILESACYLILYFTKYKGNNKNDKQ